VNVGPWGATEGASGSADRLMASIVGVVGLRPDFRMCANNMGPLNLW
jgi:hypothetical protein